MVSSAGLERTLSVEGLRSARAGDDDLACAIDRAARSAGVRPREIAAIAVSVGPGGFTGVRIAVTAAKLMAFASGGVCIAVPTARAVIRRVDAGVRAGKTCAVCLAWKNRSAWVERFSPGTEVPTAAGGVESLEELVTAEASRSTVVVADAALAELIGSVRSGPRPVFVEPVFDPVAVLEASACLPVERPECLAPIYPREPEAVTKWRERTRQGAG